MRYTEAVRKARQPSPPAHPALVQELPSRLTEIEIELQRHNERKSEDRSLTAITGVAESMIGPDKAIQFALAKKVYAAGHSDLTYEGSNHCRGIRHIRFYEAGKVVLDIEGDFEVQQLGSNFRFKNVDVYIPGDWEADLVKLTDRLRHHSSERRLAFNKKRAAEHAKRYR